MHKAWGRGGCGVGGGGGMVGAGGGVWVGGVEGWGGEVGCKNVRALRGVGRSQQNSEELEAGFLQPVGKP